MWDLVAKHPEFRVCQVCGIPCLCTVSHRVGKTCPSFLEFPLIFLEFVLSFLLVWDAPSPRIRTRSLRRARPQRSGTRAEEIPRAPAQGALRGLSCRRLLLCSLPSGMSPFVPASGLHLNRLKSRAAEKLFALTGIQMVSVEAQQLLPV